MQARDKGSDIRENCGRSPTTEQPRELQFHRQSSFEQGRDLLRRKPYSLFRIRIDAEPVLLRWLGLSGGRIATTCACASPAGVA